MNIVTRTSTQSDDSFAKNRCQQERPEDRVAVMSQHTQRQRDQALQSGPTSGADRLFREYGASHQNPINKAIHWVAVPVIFMSVIGLLQWLPFPATPLGVNWAVLVAGGALWFYVNLSPRLAVGMAAFMLLSFRVVASVAAAGYSVPRVSLIAFGIAWVFQFLGHSSLFEGKKPSFFKDLFFLLVGPAWLMHFLYKKAGVSY